jgi:hypothetical protein
MARRGREAARLEFRARAGRVVEMRADQLDVAISRGGDRVELAVDIGQAASP